MRRWVMGVLVLIAGAAGAPEPDASAAILINEILADPAGDADGDGAVHSTKDEFVELVNTGGLDVPLAGWTLSDALQVRRTFDASAVIQARGFLVTFGGLGLNNTGDTVTLRNAGSEVADAFTFGAEGGQDASLTRIPDGEGAFGLHTTVGDMFSPGATVNRLAHLPPLPLPDPEPEDPDPGSELPPIPLPDEPLPDGPGGPAVPEPSSLLLFGAGLGWLRYNRRRDEKISGGTRGAGRAGGWRRGCFSGDV